MKMLLFPFEPQKKSTSINNIFHQTLGCSSRKKRVFIPLRLHQVIMYKNFKNGPKKTQNHSINDDKKYKNKCNFQNTKNRRKTRNVKKIILKYYLPFF